MTDLGVKVNHEDSNMAKKIDKIIADIMADLDHKLADPSSDEAKEHARNTRARLHLLVTAVLVHAESRSISGQIAKLFNYKPTMASMGRMPGASFPTDDDQKWCDQVNAAIRAGKPLPPHPDTEIQRFLEIAKEKS